MSSRRVAAFGLVAAVILIAPILVFAGWIGLVIVLGLLSVAFVVWRATWHA